MEGDNYRKHEMREEESRAHVKSLVIDKDMLRAFIIRGGNLVIMGKDE